MVILVAVTVASLCANALQHASNDAQRNEFSVVVNSLDASQSQIKDLETEKDSLQIQIANLTEQISSLQNQNLELSSQCSNITNEIDTLQTENDNLKNENKNFRSENTDLQNQLYNKGPRLITKLGTTDVKIDHTAYHSNQTRLFIEGEVWNIGTQAADDCRLHVILYIGSEVVNDTYIQLGTINALDCVNVRTDIYYYTGERLTDWKIIPEYG